MKELKLDYLSKGLEEYKLDPKNTIIRHALTNSGILEVSHSQDDSSDMEMNFDIDIKTMSVANQKQSGRCWIFAATNVLREKIANELHIPSFELSQSYIAMYDRLEKVNYTLEAIIELLDKEYDDRTLQFILKQGIGDGGQWDMFVSVVNKYGLCPKHAFKETATSGGTRGTNSLINFNIRKFASLAKKAYEEKGIEEVYKIKEELLSNVYKLLLSCYGVPPTSFDFEYTDKDGVYHIDRGLNPLSFKEKYVGNRLDDFVSLINAPTKDKPFNKTYNVKYLGNVVGGKEVTHLNVSMERMKELIIKQLKDGQITWFGSDVAFYGTRETGIWDDRSFDTLTPFGMDWLMDKGDSLDYSASQMGHAMCLTGVALKDNKATKWKVENSWGKDAGQNGYYIMSSSWFDAFVYQAVIDKKYLSKEELDAFNETPIMLKPWDPMGSLAD